MSLGVEPAAVIVTLNQQLHVLVINCTLHIILSALSESCLLTLGAVCSESLDDNGLYVLWDSARERVTVTHKYVYILVQALKSFFKCSSLPPTHVENFSSVIFLKTSTAHKLSISCIAILDKKLKSLQNLVILYKKFLFI